MKGGSLVLSHDARQNSKAKKVSVFINENAVVYCVFIHSTKEPHLRTPDRGPVKSERLELQV
jgi:hypothetical protein